MTDPPTKKCSCCRKYLPTGDFYPRSKARPDGPLASRCKTCSPLSAKRSPKQRRERHLVRTYGLTAADYTRMFADQEGVCAICHDAPALGTTLCVDHDHTTGKVRGLLCGPCNSAIAFLKHDPLLLQEAARYVEEA